MKYKNFIKLCRMSQEELRIHLAEQLALYGYLPVIGDGFVYAKGDVCDVLLTAHLDTVHQEKPKDIVIKKGTISSPQGIGGDDRCGIYIILRILSETDYRPSILFCEDEEIGGVGSSKFVDSDYITDLSLMKFLVEIDRHGNNDAVFYSCDNPDFTDFILDTTGYKENWGTFSDIGNLSPASGAASVNLSCGYYKEHTKEEYVVYDEMMHTKNVVVKLLKAAKSCDFFEYIEEEITWSTSPKTYGYSMEQQVWIMYQDGGQDLEEFYTGSSMYEAFGMFFYDHPHLRFNDILDYDVYLV